MTIEQIIEKDFNETFIVVNYSEGIVENQTHLSYPCYISKFQEECFKDFLRTSYTDLLSKKGEEIEEAIERYILECKGGFPFPTVEEREVRNVISIIKDKLSPKEDK